MSKLFGMIKAGAKDFIDDECMVSGAALAYYTIFSMPPLLVMVFFVASIFNVPEHRITELVSEQLGMPVPESTRLDESPPGSDSTASSSAATDSTATDSSAGGAEAPGGTAGSGTLQQVAERQSGQPTPLQTLGPVSKVIGILILVFSATSVFAQLQRSLNQAWEVEPDPDQGGWKNFLVKRGLSLGMVVVIAFLLLVSFVLTTLIDEVVTMVFGENAGTMGMIIGEIVNNLVALVTATLLFAAMYKILPDADMRWKDMWMGAFITAVLFVIGKTAIAWYLRNSNMGDAWGSAASSMIALLVWVYYTSLIVLFGAEMTQAWATRYGHGIVPENGAVRVVEERKHIRGEEAARRPQA